MPCRLMAGRPVARPDGVPLAPFGPRTGRRGMVAAADQLAASAGLAMLARGGSAADAAVATGTAMAVVGPHLCGLGGDVLAMVAAAGVVARGAPLHRPGRRRAPTPARMRAEGMATMPVRGDIRSVQVPGAVDGWLALHERYGRLPLDEVLAPAIELAVGGLPRLHHAGAGQPSRPRPARCRRALPGRPARHRADGAAARHRPHAARHRPPRPGRLLPGRVRPGPARPRATATSRRPTSPPARPSWCTPLRAGGLGPRPVDRAAALAGLPDAGRRRRGRGGRARAPIRTTRSGPTCSSRPGAPSATTARTCSSTAPTATRSSTPSAWPPRPPGSTRRSVAAARRGAGPRHHRSRRGPPRATATPRTCARMDADGLGVSLTQSNALDFGSHLVEPTHRRLPAQPRRRLLARRGPPGRGGAGTAAAAHPLPHARHRRRDGALTHLVGAMGGDAQPQIIVQLLARLLHAGQDPATRHRGAPAHPRRARRPGPSASGGARTSPCWWRRTRRRPGGTGSPAAATGCGPSAPSTPSPSAAPRSSQLERDADGVPPPGGGVGPPQPGRRRAGPLSAGREPGRRATRCGSRPWPSRSRWPSRCSSTTAGWSAPASALEMNPYCRRAVAEGVTLARETGGTCTVVTLGPPSAEDVLREAVAWGADDGLHACDPAFAGSDTLATARALAAVLRAAGPFDLVLLGRNSIDGETGQVGPELAELLDLPFASGVRRLQDLGAGLAPRARARRRDAGGGADAARRALGGRAPLRPLQGRPRGSGRRVARRGSPGWTPPASARGPGGRRAARPWSGRRGPWSTTRALRVLDGPVDDAGRRGGARARPDAAP